MMKKKNSVYELTKAFLTEESSEEDMLSEKEGEDSLDAQVDRLLSDYESEAKSLKKEGKDWRMTVRRILEAEEESAPAALDSMSSDDIDVSSFTNSVIRLIENYDSLLEVKNTILRRAVNFLEKSYDNDVIAAFKDALKDEHGVEIGKSKSDVEDEFAAPPAGAAGPIGSAGGPGGV